MQILKVYFRTNKITDMIQSNYFKGQDTFEVGRRAILKVALSSMYLPYRYEPPPPPKAAFCLSHHHHHQWWGPERGLSLWIAPGIWNPHPVGALQWTSL